MRNFVNLILFLLILYICLIKDTQRLATKDYILKAVVHCTFSQQGEPGNEDLKKAQTFHQSIWAQTTENVWLLVLDLLRLIMMKLFIWIVFNNI